MSTYQGIRRAQLSLDYLHANSTTHEFLFGALAEMVDNARDAQATQLEIFDLVAPDIRGGFGICFLDDGEGMLPEEAARIVTFGYSVKRAKSDNLIGMYGNGLKSGSMRIGNDLIVFTKKNDLATILFLSRTFHEAERLIEVIVPVPSFDLKTGKLLDDGDLDLHKQEVDIILKYSPFKSQEELMAQIDRINGDFGTLVIVYNLKLLDTGEPELHFTEGDIVLSNPPGQEFDSDEVLHEEQKSFAAYCAILYMDPRMKIYIRSKKVQTRKLLADLYKPRMYKYSSSRFKSRSESELKKAELDALKFDHLAKEAESKSRELQKKCVADLANVQVRQECRRVDEEASRMRQQAQLHRLLVERKKRELKDPKTLVFYFGMQLNHRGRDGAFIYNCSRLISMYHRFAEGIPRGLVAIVDVPYLVLEPTHNKQDFADAKEFRHLMRALSEHAMSYCRDLGFDNPVNLEKMWSDFGYFQSNDWNTNPSDEPRFQRKRRVEVPTIIQCDSCLKWRVLPFSVNPPLEYPHDWHCALNTDASCNRCGAPEQRQAIPEAVFQRPVVNQAEAAEKLQEEIRKKQAQLDKINPNTSSNPPRSAPKPSEEVVNVKTRSSIDESESSSRLLRPRRSAPSIEEPSEEEPVASEPAKRQKISQEAAVPRGRSANRSADASRKVSSSNDEDDDEEEEESGPALEATIRTHRRSPPKRPQRRRVSPDVENEESEEETEKETKKPSKESSQKRVEPKASISNSPTKHSVVSLGQSAIASIVDNYRSCIRYFLPPAWSKFNKEKISTMPASDLVNFPQQEFFDEYERGLKQLVGKLRDDNVASRKQLGNVRRLTAQLLERILDKPPGSLLRIVTENPDSTEIDELLKSCVDKTNSDGKRIDNHATASSSKSSRKNSSLR